MQTTVHGQTVPLFLLTANPLFSLLQIQFHMHKKIQPSLTGGDMGVRGNRESTLYDTGVLGGAKKSGWAAAKFAVDGGKLRKSTMNDSSPPRVRPFARGID